MSIGIGVYGPEKPHWLYSNGVQPPPAMVPPVSLYHNAVYYPNWRIYRKQPPSSLNIGAISHIFYAFARIEPNGQISLSDQWADTQIEVDGTQGCLRACAQLKQRHPLLKVLLSIGGGGRGSENFARMAGNADARERFARSTKALVDEYGLDGIDIDWEYPSNAQQGKDYGGLLSFLRLYFPSPRYTLSSALPAHAWALQHLDLRRVSHYLDLINLMTYDFSGPWSNLSGHHSQLYSRTDSEPSGQSGVTYLLTHSVPARKILLGIPVYGRSFTGASAPGQPYTGHAGEEGTFEYRDLPRPGTQELFDEQACAAYCLSKDAGFVSYDSCQTVEKKARFVRFNGLGGLFYWTGTADKSGRESLVLAGYHGLHS